MLKPKGLGKATRKAKRATKKKLKSTPQGKTMGMKKPDKFSFGGMTKGSKKVKRKVKKGNTKRRGTTY